MENVITLMTHRRNSSYIFILKKISSHMVALVILTTRSKVFNIKTIDQAFVMFTLGPKMLFLFLRNRKGILGDIYCLFVILKHSVVFFFFWSLA